ncbi:hypothetical protein ABBQ38_006307 [Trebouxia sp. C0009 RCD-2024]
MLRRFRCPVGRSRSTSKEHKSVHITKLLVCLCRFRCPLRRSRHGLSISRLLCPQVVVSSERGTLKDVLINETVELETEMVIGIMKDVASALRYLHQLEPPILAKEINASGVVLNTDYGAQLNCLHLAMAV